ncbi:TPA: hypothetical protein I9Y78_003665 [Elizabethkingia anophelis]|nr:hypothetical protein [Elizabethkingia anophelis]HAT3998194.1 hypothetical protein [Elizabethkingia anophelis]HAT4005743.1 hypothetical protein [Elizabethkingia anophelis]
MKKHNEKIRKMNPKKKYIPPKIKVELIEMEHSFLASSVIVSPNNPVNTDWEGEDSQTVDIPWS